MLQLLFTQRTVVKVSWRINFEISSISDIVISTVHFSLKISPDISYQILNLVKSDNK